MHVHTKFTNNLLTNVTAVGYQPLPGEPNPLVNSALPISLTLPSDASVDPLDVARFVTQRFKGQSVCVYVPGVFFDAYGTRHGRGGGWYDRFFAAVPVEWMRVGHCFESNFSKQILVRQVWDQPVDWVLVHTPNGIQYYETNARVL